VESTQRVYGVRLFFVSARTNKRHHHHLKLFAWGEGDSGAHVLPETTSRGLCGLVCPSRTIERGGEGDYVKEGGGGEGKREWEVAAKLVKLEPPQSHADFPIFRIFTDSNHATEYNFRQYCTEIVLSLQY
jgi:hypothetical protein